MTASPPAFPTRREDPRLLDGSARTVADLTAPAGATAVLEAAFVRSPLPHADLVGVHLDDARRSPGVHAVLAGGDLTDVGDVPTLFGGDDPPPWRPLPLDRVRHAGEAVVLVVADDRYRAEDAVARVGLDLRRRPGRRDPVPGDPPLYPGRDDVAADVEFGPPVAPSTWERAAVVVETDLHQQLLAPTSLEARAILACPQDDGGLAVWCSHQYPHALRDALATALDLDPHDVRVVVPDVGGAFGGKSPTFPEYLAVAVAARRLGRAVRWVEDRTEALHAATRGRGQHQHLRMAADGDGRLLAIDLGVDAAIGAHPVGAGIPGQTGLAASGAYAVPEVHARVRSVLTTTAPTFAYRGAGRPEAAFAVERGVDLVARALDLDPVVVRRRNLVRSFPYLTPTGRRYDSGDYEACLDRALELLEPGGWRAEQARRRRDGGAPLGIGVACYVERSGGEPGILEEYARVEARDDGTVVAGVGTSNTGQSHETVLPGVVARTLGIDAGRVHLVEGDTARVAEGHGSFASRSMQMGGAALDGAARALVAAARERAAERWGIEVADVAWVAGELVGAGQRVPVASVVGDGLAAEHRFTSPPAFPYGTYAAVVEVDVGLGDVTVLRLVAVDDYGTVVDHGVVHGQTLGSITQGLGQALYEEVPLDEEGTPLLEQGLLDYLVPTAAEIPPLHLDETAVAAPDNPLGAKGAGEAGCIGVPPAVVNAVADALPHVAPEALAMPLTPATIRAALRDAERSGAGLGASDAERSGAGLGASDAERSGAGPGASDAERSGAL